MTDVIRKPEGIPRGSRWHTMWIVARDEMVRSGTWRLTHGPLLERLVVNRMAAHGALAEAAAEPWVSGSTGQLVAHPGFAVAARCDQVALSLARQLRLTPATCEAVMDESDDDTADEEPTSALDELAKLRARRAAG